MVLTGGFRLVWTSRIVLSRGNHIARHLSTCHLIGHPADRNDLYPPCPPTAASAAAAAAISDKATPSPSAVAVLEATRVGPTRRYSISPSGSAECAVMRDNKPQI